jgi:hypothetical protein
LECEACDIVVAGGDDGEPERYRRARTGYFPDGDQDAAVEAVRTLVGRTASSVEHGARNRLTVRFAGGGAVVLQPAIREVDWWLRHAASGAILDAYPTADRAPWPERDLVLRAPDGIAAVHTGAAGRAAASVAAAIRSDDQHLPGVPGLLELLASLPLTGYAGASLEFGRLEPDDEGDDCGELSLTLAHCGMTLTEPAAAEPWEVLEPWTRLDEEAFAAAMEPLLGQRAATVEHHEDGHLELAFEHGARLAMVPTAEEFPEWSAYDGATGHEVEAMVDGSLVLDDGPGGTWGTLGVLRAPAYRPVARPTTPPRPAGGGWGQLLSDLKGRRLVGVRERRPNGVRLEFAPEAVLVAETCDLTVDDGAARVLFHRTGRGKLSDRDAAIAAVGALAGQLVEGVELADDHRLTLLMSDGGALVLGRGRWIVEDWRIIDRVTDHRLASLPVFAPGGPPPGADAGLLELLGPRDEQRATIAGGLGTVTAQDAAAAGPSSLHAARRLLAAPAGLRLARARTIGLELGEPELVWPNHRCCRFWIQLGWCDIYVHAPGPYAAGRRVDDDALLQPLVGAHVREVRHEAPGRLVLRLDDDRAITLEPTVRPAVEWSAALGRSGPWIAAMLDGSLREMGPEATIATEARRWAYGPLGWL